MAEQILEQARDIVDGQIDFEGQKIAEGLSTALLTVVGVIAFIVGYMRQDITLALYIALGGSAIVFAAVIPPWPFFKQHPVKWLPVGGGAKVEVPQNLVIDGKVIQ